MRCSALFQLQIDEDGTQLTFSDGTVNVNDIDALGGARTLVEEGSIEGSAGTPDLELDGFQQF